MIERTQQRRIHPSLCLVLLLILVACGKSSSTQTLYTAGQTAQVDGWQVTVHGLFPVQGDEWHQPAEGHIFCAVQLTLENTTKRIRYVMPEKQMQLLDAANHAFAPGRAAGVMAARSQQWYVPQGEVGPGQVLQGAAAYEIPADCRGLRWVFRSGLWPWSKTAVFVLGDVAE